MAPKRDIKEFNPFPGLRPFAPGESEFFFGRGAESNEVILKLLKNRYIAIVGSSGNGKSSLVNGGILPKLRNLKGLESSLWRTISFRPGNDPFGNLATALSEGLTEGGALNSDKDSILSELENNKASLSDLVRNILAKKEENILFIIDQFEELFRYNSNGKTGNPAEITTKFVELIVNSVVKPDVNVFIVLTMRSEFMGECSRYKGLAMFVNNSNYLVPDLTTDNYREIIEGPLNCAGVNIDPKLVSTLLEDIGRKNYQLPVVQHALMRTWEHWQELDQPEKQISKSDYELIGSMDNAISIHADEIFDQLDTRGKEICTVLFKAITRKGFDNKGLRNPSCFGTIKSIAGCSGEELSAVIDKFRSAEVSFISPPSNIALNDKTIIDLNHECIARLWDKLKIWIETEASSMEKYLRLSEASALYQQGKASLFKASDLQQAVNWREQFKPTLAWAVQYNPAFERAMVYLRTSEAAYLEEEQNKIRIQQRKLKRTRMITRVLGAFVLIFAGFILFAYTKKIAAERQTTFSEKQRMQALREKALADSFAIIVLEQKIISDSTADASVKDAEEARKQKVVAEVEKSFAEKNTQLALNQKNIAIHQSESFKTARLIAEENTKSALEQRNETQRLRMLSIGKSMSLKSLQLMGQKDLQTLLAYQAYLFNKKNSGPENDADIYAGLYNVALQYNNLNFKSFKGHSGEIKSMAFLPGKNEFFTSGNDGQVLKWSLDNKDKTLQVMYSGSDIIEVLAVSPDASWLACGSSNSTIRMIPLKGNSTGYEMNGHKGGIKSLVYSYDGKYLYSAALDGKVLKWDIAARTSINVSTGLMEITSIDISSGGNLLAGISTDGNVLVWNPDHNAENFRIGTAGKNIKVVRFDPENNLLALGDADGTVELWDVNLHKKITEVKAHEGQIFDIRFNTALKQMATSGDDKKLKIFNVKDPADLTQPPVTFADNDGFVLSMQFSQDGQMIVSGESGGANNILSRPSNADYLVRDICNLISRNMTQEEWNTYVAKDIPLEKTCQNNTFNIKVEPIRASRK
jgi:WD40 repeat protein